MCEVHLSYKLFINYFVRLNKKKEKKPNAARFFDFNSSFFFRNICSEMLAACFKEEKQS